MRETHLLVRELEECLPERVSAELYELAGQGRIRASDISEIRLRLDRPASVTNAGANIILDSRVSGRELGECVSTLCRGSYYAHGDTIREGYIRVGDGYRVGVCGTSSSDGNVSEITSVNIRVPHIIRGVSDYLVRRCLDNYRLRSMLIYSPPGVGKTTLLRDLAARLGGEFARRVAIIDTRGEICIPEMFSDTLCDVLIGYPRARGIELATRTLSPEVLICDELGDGDEARAILTAQNTGVPLVASAHASSLGELLARPNIRLLHEHGVFDYYISISRERMCGRLSRCFGFNCATHDEASRLL
ncbi:MAG: AAA family ATPase [Clostridiales bacterium]|nr:AAA family ATPase [Clostridiales bacterium]